jgi:hypothetical protein
MITGTISEIGELRKRAPDTEAAVRAALVAGKLFRFADPHVHRIGPS